MAIRLTTFTDPTGGPDITDAAYMHVTRVVEVAGESAAWDYVVHRSETDRRNDKQPVGRGSLSMADTAAVTHLATAADVVADPTLTEGVSVVTDTAATTGYTDSFADPAVKGADKSLYVSAYDHMKTIASWAGTDV